MSKKLTKPAPMPVQAENIPAELKQMKRWVCWDWVHKDGGWTKVPNPTSTDRRPGAPSIKCLRSTKPTRTQV